MTADASRTKALIRDLAASFTKHPEGIQLRIATAEELSIKRLPPTAVLWVMYGARQEDEAVLIGKLGSHVRALSFLVRSFGMARNETHLFELITVHAPRDRSAMIRNVARTHNPTPAVALLQRILAELSIGAFKVEAATAGTTEDPAFVLTINVREFVDYSALTVAPFQGASSGAAETIVGALGTLFRAIAKKNGVRYDLVVARERVPS